MKKTMKLRAIFLLILEKTKKNAYLLLIFYNYTICKTMRKTTVDINHEKLEMSSEILRAIAHPLRLKILEFIDQNDLINVNKIYNTLNLEQSITSQHLRILRTAGLVQTERDGKFIHYSIDYDKIKLAVEAVNAFLHQPK